MGDDGRSGALRLEWLAGAALAALVVAIYARTLGFGFVNLDDALYVYENGHVLRGLSGGGVSWAFTTLQASNWHPVTWLSLMADVDLFGAGPAGHHLVNLLLHLANALLLFGWLHRVTGATWRSAVVAALFAAHPLHVESVAWISERKDVLSTLFWLLAMMAWGWYARRPRRAWYLVALALFAVGLLAKPMLVTLPLTLLLLDVWPLRRLPGLVGGPPHAPAEPRRLPALLLELLPFVAIAVASSVATLFAQASSAVVALDAISLPWRAANAAVALIRYLLDALWPARLAAFYPHPAFAGGETPSWQALGAVALLAVMSWLALRRWRTRPWLAFGWLWYLVTLAPVIGIVQVGIQARADRYTYVPLIGIFVAAVWGAAELADRWRLPRGAAGSVAVLAVLAFSAVAWQQVGTWRDSVTLWRRALAVTGRNWQAWTGLGEALAEQGRLDEAIEAYGNALQLHRRHAAAWNGLAVANGRLGRLDVAVQQSEEAVRLDPRHAVAWYNLGATYGSLGRHERAAACFREAVRLRPDFSQAWSNLAVASAALGDRDGAADAWRGLQRIDPDAAEVLRSRIGAALGP